MATATKAKSKKGGSQLDQRAKIKVIAASVLLVLAIGWILIWSFGSGGSGIPEVTPEEVQQIKEEHEQHIQKVQEELKEKYQGRTPPPPAGS
jgi:hypothetical protein